MNFSNLISNIQWLPVIVLTVFSFALGMLWHRPFLFGKVWTKENYPDQSKIKVNAPLVFGGTAVLHFITIAALSAVISGKGGQNGALAGFLISILYIFPAMGGTYLFASRSVKLLLIDSGMYVVLFSICGFVLGIW